MGFCNNCEDVVHNWAGKKYEKYNHVNDILLCINIIIAALHFRCIDVKLFKKVLPLLVAVYVFRQLLAYLTNCDAPVCTESRPTLSSDQKWYIISGHLTINMFVTYLIINSTASMYIKYTSILITALIFIVGILSREHYSKDMVLTLVFVYMAIKLYG